MNEFDLTAVNSVDIVKAVYRNSRAQGMGFLHFTEGELSDDEAQQCISQDGTISMDYVRGRSCKVHLRYDNNGRRMFTAPWFDHTDEQVKAMLADLGIMTDTPQTEHSCGCACPDCDMAHAQEFQNKEL
jgi:hypothetical protein